MNPVSERLGRKRGPTAEAQRKAALVKCEQIRKELGERRPISKTHRQLLESLKAEGVI